ncbi:MAG: bile acid:sodium symporter family protein [Desulfovibrionaceae bacterium]|nr:bile acid:sodium symporter family protein [Desulfovibrionaceae bacterium]
MFALRRLSAVLSRHVGLVTIFFSILACCFPNYFRWASAHSALFLSIIMLGMGLTIKLEDFVVVFRHPKPLMIGFFAQFLGMPLLALLIVSVLPLPPEATLGILLIGCCPGGTSSNVLTYMAGGDVALSVGMTVFSTLAAPVVTPLLFYGIADSWVSVSFGAMCLSTLKIVLLPVLGGIFIRRLAGSGFAGMAELCPLISITGIVLIVGGILASNVDRLLECGAIIALAAAVQTCLGLLFGYGIARLCRMSYARSSAVSVEVGIQNSGLSVALAALHLSAYPLAVLPGVINASLQVILGSVYAGLRRRMMPKSAQ